MKKLLAFLILTAYIFSRSREFKLDTSFCKHVSTNFPEVLECSFYLLVRVSLCWKFRPTNLLHFERFITKNAVFGMVLYKTVQILVLSSSKELEKSSKTLLSGLTLLFRPKSNQARNIIYIIYLCFTSLLFLLITKYKLLQPGTWSVCNSEQATKKYWF